AMLSIRGDHEKVPLSFLLKKEIEIKKRIEKPEISHGQASHSKKGEDFTFIKSGCQRALGDGVGTFSVFALFDGHNGSAAAVYAKEKLLSNVLNAIPPDLNSDEWLSALPRALVSGFVKTDKDFQEQASTSGTTATLVIIKGWIVTVASIGDSRCALESTNDGGIHYHYLSADHRLDCNDEERRRITASGGEVARINTGGGREIGPLRCWPGGLCVSRSIGDKDIGEFIVPIPHVKQVKLSSGGGRLIVASDGVWDALSLEMAFDSCRGMPAEAAAAHIVKEAVMAKGLRDDTTCIVVDVQPQEVSDPPPKPPKKPKQAKRAGFFESASSQSMKKDGNYKLDDSVEELFDQGSALLSERLDLKYPICNMFKLFVCAVCQLRLKPGEGISVYHHHRTNHQRKVWSWNGPLLCSTCHEKKDAMEGKT
ncbi:hypothetical protein M569_15272, partial [Genlisea aurea]